eukprot:295124_1
MELLCVKLLCILYSVGQCEALQTASSSEKFKSAYDIVSSTSINHDGSNSQSLLDTAHSRSCDETGHPCISVSGLSATGNPEINDIYCPYECDVHNYIKFQSQNTCSFYVKWIPNHYIIYSYTRVRFGTVSNHLFASARECDRSLNGYEHLSTCSFWNVFDHKDDVITEHNVTVDRLSITRINECTTPTGVTHVNMDKGEIAAIVILLLAVFVVVFGSAMRCH